MQVREGMSTTVLTVGPGHTLRETARLMSERKVGAAVVIDPDGHGPGIITERDILHSIAAGHDPDDEAVAEHLTRDVVFAAPDWSLEEAATEMVRGGFRHLIVVEEGATWGSSLYATWCAAGPMTERSVQCLRARPPRWLSLLVRVERKLVDFAAGVSDPADDAADREQHADDCELDEGRDADERQRDAHRGEHRQETRAGEVDLFAGGRDLGVKRAHEM